MGTIGAVDGFDTVATVARGKGVGETRVLNCEVVGGVVLDRFWCAGFAVGCGVRFDTEPCVGFKAGAYVGTAVVSAEGSSVGIDVAAIENESVGPDVLSTLGFVGVMSEAESEQRNVGHCVTPDVLMVRIADGSLVGFDVGGACFGGEV